jgi:hypothetical protein
MKFSLACLTFATALIASGAASAQVPAAAPAGSTGLCKDGSYTSDETKKGACSGHKGVKEWFGAVASVAPAKSLAATAPAPASPAATTKPVTQAAPRPAAAGGGPGQVWVNTKSRVYHCSGTKYYGTTKKGEYMTEAAAKAAGAHADHGKACS